MFKLTLLFIIIKAWPTESIHLIVQPQDVFHEREKVAVFPCIFNDEPPQCIWMKDGGLILEDSQIYKIIGDKSHYDCSLEVFLPETNVNHTFQCVSPEIPNVMRSVKSNIASLLQREGGLKPLPLIQELVVDDFGTTQSTPVLLVNPTNQTVHTSGLVTITCIFNKQPSKCAWYRNGNPLYFESDERYTIQNASAGDCSLQIENVTLQTEGSYRCESPETISSHLVRSDEADVTIIYSPTAMSIIYDGVSYTSKEIHPNAQMESVNISCFVKECRPRPRRLFWKFRGNITESEIEEVEVAKQSLVHSYMSHISISTDSELKEDIECVLEHPGLQKPIAVSATVVVTKDQRMPVIKYNGTILQHGDKILIQVGNTLHLKCISSGSDPRVQLSWYTEKFGEKPGIMTFSRGPHTGDGKVDAVINYNTTPTDDMDIYCQAKHKNLNHLLEAKVAVQIFSPLTTVHAEFASHKGSELAVLDTDIVNVTCVADGNLPTSYKWFFKSNVQSEWELISDEKHVTRQHHEGGKYFCKANNGYDPQWFPSNEITVRLKDSVTVVEAGFSVFPEPQISIPIGDEVSAICVPNGDPPHFIKWYSRVNISSEWNLMESEGRNITIKMEGQYKCAAGNEASRGNYTESNEIFVTIAQSQMQRSASGNLTFMSSCILLVMLMEIFRLF